METFVDQIQRAVKQKADDRAAAVVCEVVKLIGERFGEESEEAQCFRRRAYHDALASRYEISIQRKSAAILAQTLFGDD